MATLTIRDRPDDVHERLEQSADVDIRLIR
jgi:hypothetical protein